VTARKLRAQTQLRAIGQFDGHPVLVLAQADQFATAPDLGAGLDGVLGQQADGDCSRDAEDVRMRGVQPVWLRLVDAGEEPPSGYCRPSARNCRPAPSWSSPLATLPWCESTWLR
jgi:hypothetical protein